MSDWIERLGDGYAVWGGDGGMYLLDCVRSGAAGIIPGVDLVDLLVRVYDAEARGDTTVADERLRELLPMLVFEMQHSIDHYNACAKEILVHRGVLARARLRPPAGTLGGASRALLDRHLAALRLSRDGVGVG
jgi:4-hydroxy-tetrahydrodipicolinate synthase